MSGRTVNRRNRFMAMVVALVLLCGMLAAMPAQAASFTSKKPSIKSTSAYINGKVVLKWSKVSGAKKYQVYRASSKSGKYKLFATTTKASLSKKADGLYWYKVRAVKGKKKSKFSTPVRVFAANAKITKLGFSGTTGIYARVKITNKTKKVMTFLGTNLGTLYLVNKKTQKKVGSTPVNVSTSLDAYGISYGMGKQIKAKKSASLWVSFFDYSLWMKYSGSPDSYTWLVTLPFYPGGGESLATDSLSITAGLKSANSSVPVKK